jgi:hypothetical protein
LGSENLPRRGRKIFRSHRADAGSDGETHVFDAGRRQQWAFERGGTARLKETEIHGIRKTGEKRR